MGGCWDVMGGRVLRWRWGRPPSCQGLNNDSSGQVRVKGRRVRFHSGPRRSASLVRVTRPRERRRLWIARIWLRFRRRRAPEPCPDPGWHIVHVWCWWHKQHYDEDDSAPPQKKQGLCSGTRLPKGSKQWSKLVLFQNYYIFATLLALKTFRNKDNL